MTRVRLRSVLLGLSLAWFGWTLWSAHTNIIGAGDELNAVLQAADALPVVISAAVLSGAASSMAVLGWLSNANWAPLRQATRLRVRDRLRWPLAVGVGALVGALALGLVLLGYGHRSSIVVLAVAVLVAAVLGGALGALKPGELASAGVAGTLAVFLVSVALHSFPGQLMRLFGAGSSPGSVLSAATRLALTTSLVGGVLAGLLAFWLLYRSCKTRRFLAYLAAGAFPGLVLLLAELVTRVGGAQLFHIVSGLSSGDQTLVDYWANTRLDHALVVLFVGAITALLCFGRSLPAKQPTAPASGKAATKPAKVTGASRPAR
jgi:hypothetical protein